MLSYPIESLKSAYFRYTNKQLDEVPVLPIGGISSSKCNLGVLEVPASIIFRKNSRVPQPGSLGRS